MESNECVPLLKAILEKLTTIDARVQRIESQLQMSRASAEVDSEADAGDGGATGLEKKMKKMKVSAASPDNSSIHDPKLNKELHRISDEYLTCEQTQDQKQLPKLVSHLTEKFILPNLADYHSAVSYMGSAYEFTSVPGKSDHDIQFFIKVPFTKQDGKKTSAATLVKCEDPAWALVKGGPPALLDGDGFLSTEKARKLIQSAIDKALTKSSSEQMFDGSKVTIRRAASGPATTLNVDWRNNTVSIDIVVCLQAVDVNGSEFDLVAKPNEDKRVAPAEACKRWRLSYSKQELSLLRDFHKTSVKKLILLRLMKVIKLHHPQLKSLPSYFFKNILFKMVEDKPDAGWERVNLAERFKDMVKAIQEALDTQTLYLHFNKHVNYLAEKDGVKQKNIGNYLKRIIQKEKYSELLSVVPSRDTKDELK